MASAKISGESKSGINGNGGGWQYIVSWRPAATAKGSDSGITRWRRRWRSRPKAKRGEKKTQ